MTYQSVFRDDYFKEKTIIVTGGGSGIGRCLAHELCSLGANVVITGRNKSKLECVVNELSEYSGAAKYYVCDSRDEQQVSQTVDFILDSFGAIDGLVNNAGGQYPALLEGLTLKGFNAVINNNLNGTFLMMREVYTKHMRDNGGAIVNMSIAFTSEGLPGMGHSGCSRAGVENLTKTAATEWARSNVRVNCVSPGWILSSGLDSYKKTAVEAMLPLVEQKVPMHRKGSESEVSGSICYLLSEAAAYVTGVTLRIDGGTTLSNQFFPLSKPLYNNTYDGFKE